MSFRLPQGGRLIDRARPLSFSFDGRRLTGYAGDTLASALLGAGETLVGRSFKYHRPRGIVAAGPEEPNALVTLGRGARVEPNARATEVALHEGLEAVSQNRWPSLAFDLGQTAELFRGLLPAGFYYKTFIHPRPAWKHLFEPLIRRAAGLGRPPQAPDPDRYDQLYAFADVAVVGGGIAGLHAARLAAAAGARVILLEQAGHWGGRAVVEGEAIGGQPAAEWVAAAVAGLAASPAVTMRLSTVAFGLYDHGYLLAEERPAAPPADDAPRRRLWRIRAAQVIVAAGAIERPIAFAGNDRPGVMLAGAVRDYLANWAVAPGRATVVATLCDDGYRTALALAAAGCRVAAVVDARPAARGALAEQARAAGLRVLPGMAVARVHGGRGVTGVTVAPAGGDGAFGEEIACDAVAMAGGWSPAVHLWCQPGGRLVWDEGAALFRPDPARPPLGPDGQPSAVCAGAAAGAMAGTAVLADADRAVRAALARLGRQAPEAPPPEVAAPAEEAPAPPGVWPARARAKLRAKAFLDFQNDVKVSDIELAAREGYVSVEHAKRYTTLGMATDQGKLSNIPGLAVLAAARGDPVAAVGTTTFRPPFVPVTIGALAGEAKGDTFQPVRRTPMHGWHEAAGAVWEPVGLWRRPYAYPRPGERRGQAVAREVLAVRRAVGLLDASTLGKILVRGPDAGRFLDMLYTNVMSTLAVGRCRYGLMCSEQGFVMDDGVVARLGPETFLVHTTTGGADRIHAWMEDWLQTEWWDWKVFTANLTEQYAQVVVAGPQARTLLQRLGGMDVSRAALPFMHWAEGRLGGVPARLFRISFSGELSYEVAVAASEGLALWEALLAAGEDLGVTPYGTEALHVLRAEKGYIMIGDETDGTVTPRDLGLDRLVSARKADFLGKRGMERPHLVAPDRWRLVGLAPEGSAPLPEGAYAATAARNANGQIVAEGRVTSTYHSPTLGRPIALGLVRRGPERMGDLLRFPTTDGREMRARIVPPVFYDPAGERLDG